MMDLKNELAKLNEQLLEGIPQEIKDVMQKVSEDLAQKELEKVALKVGDKLPHFILDNAVGKKVDSNDLLLKGPLVISFYRGGWCPYCNLELRAYEAVLPQIRALGANLIAISPELPDASLTLAEKYALKYEVLSDLNNKTARTFGLVFTLPEELIAVYKKMGIDILKTQENGRYELPMPATYVADQNGTIILAYVNSDYTNRLQPEEVLKLLENYSSKAMDIEND